MKTVVILSTLLTGLFWAGCGTDSDTAVQEDLGQSQQALPAPPQYNPPCNPMFQHCPPTNCMGSSDGWHGCRGSGCGVCQELVANYPLYFKNHSYCVANPTCGGQYYACSNACGAPTAADLCNGSPGGWAGCRGNGCSVCVEMITSYPKYLANHPYCKLNPFCSGLHFTCNENCPAPSAADR